MANKNLPWQGGAAGFAKEDPNHKPVESQQVRDGSLASYLEGNKPMALPPVDPESIVAANDEEKEVLKEAIPAEVMERALAKRERREKTPRMSDIHRAVDKVQLLPPKEPKRQIVRGDVLLHVPTKRQVTVVKPDVGVSSKGEIKHRVMTRGLARKFEVPESSLEELP